MTKRGWAVCLGLGAFWIPLCLADERTDLFCRIVARQNWPEAMRRLNPEGEIPVREGGGPLMALGLGARLLPEEVPDGPQDGMQVTRVSVEQTAYRMGIRRGDILHAFARIGPDGRRGDPTPIRSVHDWSKLKLNQSLVLGERISFTVSRREGDVWRERVLEGVVAGTSIEAGIKGRKAPEWEVGEWAQCGSEGPPTLARNIKEGKVTVIHNFLKL